MNNLRLKDSRGDRYVNTPKTGEFTFKIAEDLQQVAATDDIEFKTIRTITATIVGVSNVTKSMGCVVCKGKVEVKDGMIAVCSICKVKQKTMACKVSWFGSIIVQSEDNCSKNIRLAMFNSQIVKLLDVSKSSINLATASTEDLSDEILLINDTLNITYDSVKSHMVDVNIVDI